MINEIIDYWFSDSVKKHWFSSTPKLDREITSKYQALWQQAKAGDLKDWANTDTGCLALIIVLDQFPLNIFRGQALSFSTESRAIELAHNAINNQLDKSLKKEQLIFLYMPLMHSEKISDQNLSVELAQKHHLNNVDFAKHHQSIVKKFARFPHRNKILKRTSTQEELEYLNSNNAFLG